ncbi:unnamed protein product [Cylicocyclus nassatus]|uniref:Uncharacterized protein n=1 Tax=Cylicocyclus nassatus TaxID=53992 RepID=A0AA36H0Z4_CYLNA|nr:unnamed protein product [Cylicocyclus nassatus]
MSFGYNSSPPPKKRSRTDQQGDNGDDADSDDSFNDPVLAEPSQITQAILQRREAVCVDNGRQMGYSIAQSSICTSPLRPQRDDETTTRKSLLRTSALTPRRFNAQDRSDYHHNGQVLMLKNRVENLEREKERSAAAIRDQIIAKEKEHKSELSRQEERIRQLEAQIMSLRQENLQTSFNLHNASLANADIEMTDANTTLPRGPLLHTKKVNILRHDIKWKTGFGFGSGASVFTESLSNRGGPENGTQAFPHVPGQLLIDTPDPATTPICSDALFMNKAETVLTDNKECQVNSVAADWNVHSYMRESALESLLSITMISQESNFDLSTLSVLCRPELYLNCKSLLRLEAATDSDSDFD